MSALFVTATGTDIGKSFVACGIIAELRRRGRRVAALKPLVSGYDDARAAESDPGRLLAALGRDPAPAELDRISPWRFRAPLAPDLAAKREGKKVDFAALVEFCRDAVDRQDNLLIEGVGGVMSPISDRQTVLDWMVELEIPVLLVSGSYLGAQSHALTALAALRGRRLALRAVVVNESPDGGLSPAETANSLARFARGTELLALPRLSLWNAPHETFCRLADGFNLSAAARA
ncbi:MAG TPA: dethiobiotin synthase [Stellaceae bacterium]|nr:dethiobiotin synthase [Stellaceae bacterium]